MSQRAWEVDALRGLMLVLMTATHLPTRFAVADGPVSFNAVVVTASPATGRASGIEQVQRLIEV